MKNDENYFVQYLKKYNIKYNYGMGTIGQGWMPLLEDLTKKLIQLGWNKEIGQCKEKFGGMRLYLNLATDEMYELVHKAETDSYKICEDCGNPGTVGSKNGGYWIRTLCAECRNKEK